MLDVSSIRDPCLKDEQAAWPDCRCEISMTSCSSNLAVENTVFVTNHLFKLQHDMCVQFVKSTVKKWMFTISCIHERFRCPWDGLINEVRKINRHIENCTRLNKPCSEILRFLKAKEMHMKNNKYFWPT